MSSLRDRLLRHLKPGAASGESQAAQAQEEAAPQAGSSAGGRADADGLSGGAAGAEVGAEAEAVPAGVVTAAAYESGMDKEAADAKTPSRESGTATGAAAVLSEPPGTEAGGIAEGSSAPDDEWHVIGAGMARAEWGEFVLRRRTYSGEDMHGTSELGALAGRARALAALLTEGPWSRGAASEPVDRPEDGAEPEGLRRGRSEEKQGTPSGESADPLPSDPVYGRQTDEWHQQFLFLDTETTGLGHGAGNVPFMIGIGFYEGDSFVVEQMLIRHPGEEAAMLGYLQEKLRTRPILISYNGKSFDWPIVRNRYIMNRLRMDQEPAAHLDFLYPSRRLWKHTLPSCRLGLVEELRLGVRRDGDVPGAMAPVLYFRYLAEKDPLVLQGVFLHNELDVLSLAGLAVLFARLLEGSLSWKDVRAYGTEEWFRLGLWLEKAGLAERADEALLALADELLAGGSAGGEADSVPLPLADAGSAGPSAPEPADTGTHAGTHGEQEAGASPAAETTPASRRDSRTASRPAEPASGLPAEAEDAADGVPSPLLPLAQYMKRRGRYGEACALWELYLELKEGRRTASLEPCIELSMYHEHKTKRFDLALAYARQAQDLLWRRGALTRSSKRRPARAAGTADAEEAALAKRVERLERKALQAETVRRSSPSSRKQRSAADGAGVPGGSGEARRQRKRGTAAGGEQLSLFGDAGEGGSV
ncbi:hypothetical protein PM3016_3179 [Paenibacillus mucilaginosus 3016]|uniref:YprB ribonuclease H-like domain-containing protein n=2 Tax=Paenibacillus mucilaginosus TaxID=61624 RepID=H6ND73_9BACL|nr:ribonuclease H-like domain-containing protein [Paenibacillus mucilaginosus]AFC30034.1 hypothetical protein PM3016_3179 [Paenibacillus mucilaginosus 3016]AFH62220.1 hypothetical protein B2K_16080 [Paenibacillus mucilaginosus K02]WFA18690.1 hypothetical protein ERY13_16095 [Paenibacillus mucilaginosus]